MELAVVLVIVALLLGGLLVPLGAQRDVEFTRATEKSLADIREALIGFAAINGYLPCPAQASVANGAANAGIEARDPTSLNCACATTTSPGVATVGSTQCALTSSSDSVGGVLPWATLGLLERDAWANRYTYHVGTFYARSINPVPTDFDCTPLTTPTNAVFAPCTLGAIAINTAASGGTAVVDVGAAVAVVVSHGGSGQGAYTTQGTQLPVDADDSNAAENVKRAAKRENSDGDTTFVSNTTIDDRLVWISRSQLMNRMMSAGRLP